MSINVTVQYRSHVTVQYYVEPSTADMVQHSIMVNITLWCFDQLAKQLIVGHMTNVIH